MSIELVWNLHCGTGENPLWDEAHQRLLFCDIPARQIHAFTPATAAQRSWTLPEVVGSFGLCASGRLIVAQRHRVVFYDLDSETLTAFTDAVDEPPTNRLNDGKVAPDGSFWVGSMDENTPRRPTGHLYRVTPDGRITRMVSGLTISNGLAWSPDGRTMYHADTPEGVVYAWDYHQGEIGNRRVFARLSEAQGRPDGGAVDAQGCYWSAGVSAGHLNRFAADGTLTATIALPTATPTMACFTPGWLYITSLRRAGVAADSPDGGLFRMPTHHVGTAIAAFPDL
jgi:sugar lactone lactonase YvrE